MKIAIIQPRVSYFQGGGEKITLRFAQELAKQPNIEVTLYTTRAVVAEAPSFSVFKNGINRKLQVVELAVPKKFKYLYQIPAGQDQGRWDAESLFFNSLIYPLLEKHQPDLVWCDYIVDCLVKPVTVPSVLYLVGYPREYLNIRKAWLAQYDSILCISENVRIKWNSLTDGGLPQSKIIYTAPVLDDQLGQKKNVFKKNVFNILFAGRLIERKGVQTLMLAINDLSAKGIKTQLHLLGRGPYEGKLKKLAKKYKLSVKFWGHQDNLSSFYSAADICVFPSYEGEGLMGVVLEAMACGAGVVTTKNNGNEELIDDGSDGILIESRNAQQLVKALVFAHKNPQKIKTMGIAAKIKIETNFTWKKHVAQFLQFAKKFKK